MLRGQEVLATSDIVTKSASYRPMDTFSDLLVFPNASNFLSVCANASDSNVTSELWLVEDRTSGLVTAVFLLLFLVIGLPWNLLVIVTIVKQKLYTQPTIILLLSLVITDLILLVIHLPLLMVTGFYGEYILGGSDSIRCSVCKTGFITVVFTFNSIFTISLMSLDRFLFIYKPLHYERYITKWRTVVAIAVAGLIAAVLSILPLFGFGEIVFFRNSITCSLNFTSDNDGYPILLIVVGVVAIIPVIVCNIWVCCIVQRNIRAIYKVKSPAPGHTEVCRTLRKKGQEKQLHLCRVFGTLLFFNIIFWLPIIVVSLILFAGLPVTSTSVVFAQIFFLSQSTVHPIIESTLIKEVRVPLKSLLFCCCSKVKAKWCHKKDISSDTKPDSGRFNIESSSGHPGKCCNRHLLEILRDALLFTDTSNHIEARNINSSI